MKLKNHVFAFFKMALLSVVTLSSAAYAQGPDWVNRTPDPVTATNNPSARLGRPAMAYDSDRNRVVLFSGSSAPADTWEWDGVSWTNRTPATVTATNNPSARLYSGMAYDSERKRCVLFGGYRADGLRLRDTWEWDGSTWSERTPAALTDENSPPASTGFAMAYDSERGRVVMYGTSPTGNSKPNATWEWDGTSWFNRTPAEITATNNPSGLVLAAMSYDSVRKCCVLFGGSKFLTGTGLSDETWEWDGVNWVNRTPANITSGNNPSARERHGMAYDAVRNRTVLFGGYSPTGPTSNETWEWDGSTWAVAAPVPITANNNPSLRSDHSMVYDGTRKSTVIFGGVDQDGEAINETWERDDSTQFADLSIGLSADPSPVQNVTDVTYTVVVANRGPATAQNTLVTLPLPEGTTVLAGITGPAGWMIFSPVPGNNGTVAFTNSAFTVGNAVFKVRAHVNNGLPVGTQLSATATVSSSNFDPDASDRTSTVTFGLKQSPSLIVTTLDDSVADDGQTSLREAMTFANSNPDFSAITFAQGLSGTIFVNSALPSIASDMAVIGPGPGVVTVSRGTASFSQIFSIPNSAPARSFTVSGLTIANARAASPAYGGGLVGSGNLVVRGCIFTGNDGSSGPGGILLFSGSLLVEDSAFYGNTGATGSAIGNIGGAVVVRNSTISGNHANSDQRPAGGAILNVSGTFSLQNCTVTGNTAVASDFGTRGGLDIQNGTLTISNSIIAGNQGLDFYAVGGQYVNAGYNFIGNNAGVESVFPAGAPNGTSFAGTGAAPLDAKLGPLQNNGGPTPTCALLSGSRAINTGDPSIVAAPDSFDQRGPGYPRVNSGRIDIGAYETPGAPLPLLTVTVTPGFPATFAETAANPATKIRVTRTGSTVSSLVVSLTSNGVPRVRLPATATIAAGQTFIDVPVTAVNDTFVDGTTNVTVTASAPGYASRLDTTSILHITDDDGAHPTLSATFPAEFPENHSGPLTLTLTHNRAITASFAVTLQSTDPRLHWPASVSFPAGSRKIVVPVTVTADPGIQGTVKALLTISATGFTRASVTSTIYDMQAAISLAVAPGSPAAFGEGAGPGATTIRVSRNTPASAVAAIVSLTVARGVGRVSVPPTVIIPINSTFVDVLVTALDNKVFESDQPVQIAGVAAHYPGTGVVNLTVTENDPRPLLTANFNPTSFPENRATPVSLVISHNRASLETAVALTLRSSDARLSWPANLTIPAGSRSVTVPLTVTPTATAEGTKTATITVSAGGFTAGTATATISDSPASISAPQSPVVLSSATANAATGRVTLTFTGPLGPTAGDPSNYTVPIDGGAVDGFSVTRHGFATIELAIGGLTSNQVVSVSYNLTDSSGRPLRGTAKAIAR